MPSRRALTRLGEHCRQTFMADRCLLQAEQLAARRNYGDAMEVMEKAGTLQEEHIFKLPDEFHFKYARVAFDADSINIAYDAVVEYLITVGREGEFYKEALALSLEVEPELDVPRILPEEACSGKQRGADCWKELASHPQCYVWDEYLLHPSVTWSGGCYCNVARGRGTLIWTGGSQVDSHSGRLRQGRMHGQWVLRDESGYKSKGSFANGKRHGHWVLHSASSYKARGDYIDGKQDGTWLEKYNDSCTAITYRQDEKVGSRQVEMSKCEGW